VSYTYPSAKNASSDSQKRGQIRPVFGRAFAPKILISLQKIRLARHVHIPLPRQTVRKKEVCPKRNEENFVESPLYVLLSQQDALERQMAVVAHNVANSNTSGFKSHDMMFEDFIKRPSAKSENHFVIDRATIRDTGQGPLLKTENPLDLAISGHGYFSVQTPQGTQYTRQGSFQLDAEGNLVTADGFRVLTAEGQPINIPSNATQISVGVDGLISTDAGDVGRVSPVSFQNEQALVETYGGFYSDGGGAGPQPDTASNVYQGMIEASNVKPVAEMTKVIEISRTYQRTQQLLTAENERMRNAIRELGRRI
jgi:flagellar basal-body rod protein FlgF